MSKAMFTELPTRKVNRLLARSPKPGRFWCGTCDAYKSVESQKCPNCGSRNGVKNTLKHTEVF